MVLDSGAEHGTGGFGEALAVCDGHFAGAHGRLQGPPRHEWSAGLECVLFYICRAETEVERRCQHACVTAYKHVHARLEARLKCEQGDVMT